MRYTASKKTGCPLLRGQYGGRGISGMPDSARPGSRGMPGRFSGQGGSISSMR
ncbi:Uncharacterised protein [Bordetella pertussis]|nr:Uncharacterised protein [Bordetella pertussis]CFW32096.1 Uncharacterised protein [Bordetella pertussis]